MTDSDQVPCFSSNSKLFKSGTITAEAYFSNMLQHLQGTKHDEDSILNELKVLKPVSGEPDFIEIISLAVRRVVMKAWEWNGTGGFDARRREPLLLI
jgi:hypothetical protein